jgi:hypothetical protein
VPQKRDKCLSPCVDSEALLTKCHSFSILKERARCKLMQLCFFNQQRQAAITTGDRMAHPVTFERIEKKNLVCLGDHLTLSDMADVDAAIWEDKLRGQTALFWALLSTSSLTVGVPYRHSRRVQKRVNVQLGKSLVFAFKAQTIAPTNDLSSIALETETAGDVCRNATLSLSIFDACQKYCIRV